MSTTRVDYVGSGSARMYAVPFSFIDRSHVVVTLDAVQTTAFEWLDDGTIQFTNAPGSGTIIRIERSTPHGPLVDFQNAALITETDLNLAALQALYIAVEAAEDAAESAALTITSSVSLTMGGKRLEGLLDPVADTDAATKGWVNSAAESAVALTLDYRDAAEVFRDDAQAAEAGAVGALGAVVAAQGVTEGARDDALSYRNAAQAAAQSAAEDADDALASENAALQSRDEAEGFATTAESEAAAAEAANVDAAGHASAASGAASSAATSASAAQGFRNEAETFRDQAQVAAGGAVEMADVTGLQAALDAKADDSDLNAYVTQTALTPQLDAKVATSRTISTSGLATGGGSLAANRTITVTKASQAQAEAGTSDTVAMTPLRTKQAIAALAQSGGASGRVLPSSFSGTDRDKVLAALAQAASTGEEVFLDRVYNVGASNITLPAEASLTIKGTGPETSGLAFTGSGNVWASGSGTGAGQLILEDFSVTTSGTCPFAGLDLNWVDALPALRAKNLLVKGDFKTGIWLYNPHLASLTDIRIVGGAGTTEGISFSANVPCRGLKIKRADIYDVDDGILGSSGGSTDIEDVNIHNCRMTGVVHGVRIAGNTNSFCKRMDVSSCFIAHAGDGAGVEFLGVTRGIIHGNHILTSGGRAAHLTGVHTVLIQHNVFEHLTSGNGIWMEGFAHACQIDHNFFAGGFGTAIIHTGSGGTNFANTNTFDGVPAIEHDPFNRINVADTRTI